MQAARMSVALERFRERPALGLLRPQAGRLQAPARWELAGLAGRLSELSAPGGAAVLTLALALVWEAQEAGETPAWVTTSRSGFYPPDAAAQGIDLDALAVVRVPDVRAVSRAAERLARSGAFGLLVLDLGAGAFIPTAWQGRLVRQAQRHDTAIVCLTEKPDPASSLGSLVSLHGHGSCRREGDARFVCTLTISKDKRNGPGWQQQEAYHGPPGLR